MTLEQSFSYWKDHITLEDVFAEELAYSLIYDNIRADRVDIALGTVGLTELPDRFFLLQVDDYLNLSGKMNITQEFFQKPRLVNLLRELLREQGKAGFAANLVGMDKLICFLCGTEEGELAALTEAVKERIRSRSPYTVSLCISEPCRRISQYSVMYPRMDLALSRSYFSGKEFTIFLSQLPRQTEEEEAGEPGELCPELLAAIIRSSRSRYESLLEELLRRLRTQSHPQQSRLEVVRLLQHFEAYCRRCGTDEGATARLHENTMADILRCNFISDVRSCLLGYYDAVTALLRENIDAGEQAFRLLVEEYVTNHYAEDLRPSAMAAVLGFSEGHFTRLFRRDFGCTFVQYLSDRRIKESCRLLAETTIPVEQVAYRVGLNNYSYFCTCFKRATGLSPGVYRKKCSAERRHSEEERKNEISC